MTGPRIVITGAGIVTAAGLGSELFWERALGGVSCLGPAAYDTGPARSRTAGCIPEYDPREYIRRRSIRTLDRITRHTLVASTLALNDAGLDPDDIAGEMTGVVIGHSFGAITSTAVFHDDLVLNGPRTLNPNLFPNTVHNSSPSQIGIEWGLRGISSTIVTGLSTSGLDALAAGMNAIRFNHSRLVIAGGFDELSSKLHLALDRLNLLSHDGRGGADNREGVKPFDRQRNGTVLGEAAALLVLETDEDAECRGAAIRAELIGYGTFTGQGTKTRPALVAAIERALGSAGIEPEAVGLIVAEGSGWALGDRREAEAIRRVFGSTPPPVTSIKAITGFTLGASGVLNVLTGMLCLERGTVPAVTGLTDLDPACGCNQVRVRLERDAGVCLVLAGSNRIHSALVLRRPERG